MHSIQGFNADDVHTMCLHSFICLQRALTYTTVTAVHLLVTDQYFVSADNTSSGIKTEKEKNDILRVYNQAYSSVHLKHSGAMSLMLTSS